MLGAVSLNADGFATIQESREAHQNEKAYITLLGEAVNDSYDLDKEAELTQQVGRLFLSPRVETATKFIQQAIRITLLIEDFNEERLRSDLEFLLKVGVSDSRATV
jgi:hypothetical protein